MTKWAKKSKLRHFPWFLGKMDVCIVFYVQFWVRNDLAGCIGVVSTSSKRRREVWDFGFFFSGFLVISGYSPALNVLITSVKIITSKNLILFHLGRKRKQLLEYIIPWICIRNYRGVANYGKTLRKNDSLHSTLYLPYLSTLAQI